MSRTLLIGAYLLLLLAVTCNRHGDFKAALDAYTQHLEEMNSLLQGIGDEASMRKAEPQLSAILEKMSALRPKMEGPPEKVKAQLLRNHQELAASMENYAREMARIGENPELGALLNQIIAAKAGTSRKNGGASQGAETP